MGHIQNLNQYLKFKIDSICRYHILKKMKEEGVVMKRLQKRRKILLGVILIGCLLSSLLFSACKSNNEKEIISTDIKSFAKDFSNKTNAQRKDFYGGYVVWSGEVLNVYDKDIRFKYISLSEHDNVCFVARIKPDKRKNLKNINKGDIINVKGALKNMDRDLITYTYYLTDAEVID